MQVSQANLVSDVKQRVKCRAMKMYGGQEV
jgi:hypothetical protein